MWTASLEHIHGMGRNHSVCTFFVFIYISESIQNSVVQPRLGSMSWFPQMIREKTCTHVPVLFVRHTQHGNYVEYGHISVC